MSRPFAALPEAVRVNASQVDHLRRKYGELSPSQLRKRALSQEGVWRLERIMWWIIVAEYLSDHGQASLNDTTDAELEALLAERSARREFTEGTL